MTDIDKYYSENLERFEDKLSEIIDSGKNTEHRVKDIMKLLKDESAIVPGIQLQTWEELTSNPGIQAIGKAMLGAIDKTKNP